jgi:hypothetical protein
LPRRTLRGAVPQVRQGSSREVVGRHHPTIQTADVCPTVFQASAGFLDRSMTSAGTARHLCHHPAHSARGSGRRMSGTLPGNVA